MLVASPCFPQPVEHVPPALAFEVCYIINCAEHRREVDPCWPWAWQISAQEMRPIASLSQLNNIVII